MGFSVYGLVFGATGYLRLIEEGDWIPWGRSRVAGIIHVDPFKMSVCLICSLGHVHVHDLAFIVIPKFKVTSIPKPVSKRLLTLGSCR